MYLPSDDQLFSNLPDRAQNLVYHMEMILQPTHELKDHTKTTLPLSPEQVANLPPASLAYAYEKALTSLREQFSLYTSTRRDAKDFTNDWQKRINETMTAAIENHLKEYRGSIGLFPSSKDRVISAGTIGTTPFELVFRPFAIQSELPYALKKHMKVLRPIPYNPHAQKTKKNLIILLVCAVLAAIFYGIFVTSGMSAEMTVPFSIFMVAAACGGVGLLRHGSKYLKWQVTKGRNKAEDAWHREHFQQDALSLHKTIRFYRLWAEHVHQALPDFFDEWEQTLFATVEEFNHLPEKY